MDRLRKEGSVLVEEEIQNVMKKMETETTSFNILSHRLKLKWKVVKDDVTNGGYCEENLLKFLSRVSFIIENINTIFINCISGYCITNILLQNM